MKKIKSSLLAVSAMLMLSTSAFASQNYDFADLENLEGAYNGYFSIGSDVYSCQVKITKIQEEEKRAISVEIFQDNRANNRVPVQDVYSVSDGLRNFAEYKSVFIERHKWITGWIGGTFFFDDNGNFTQVNVGRIGPGSGYCQRLVKI